MISDDRFKHHAFLKTVADNDVVYVLIKDKSYGASWKKRGGVGVFMMLARKWDRLEEMMTSSISMNSGKFVPDKYDLMARAENDLSGVDGTVLAEVRDLRRYLLLVESEILARSAGASGVTVETGIARQFYETVQKPVSGDHVSLQEISDTPETRVYSGVPHFPDCYGRVQTMRDIYGPCDELHALGGGPCMRCGHPQNDHAHRMVPRPASHYQERVDRRALLDSGAPRPCISSELFRTLSPHLAGKYVLVGKVALVDRAQLPSHEREHMARYPQTMTCGELAMLTDWVPELYEPRTGVENEVQLRSQFREHWGQHCGMTWRPALCTTVGV